MRQRRYARAGVATCATCGRVRGDDVGRREAFAVFLDLGFALGDGLEDLGVEREEAFDLAIATKGTPLCAPCGAQVVSYSLAIAGRSAPPDCPCEAIEGLASLSAIPPCAFAFGFVLGDEVKRCATCQALARGRGAQEG